MSRLLSCCSAWGVAVSQLAARARRLQVIAVTDAGYLAQIHDTAELAKSARSPDAVVDHVKEQLTGLLDLKGCRQFYGRFMLRPKPGSSPPLQARLVAVSLADQAGRALGADVLG